MRRVLRILIALAAVGFSLVVYVYLMLPDVRPLATVNPATTAFMELRAREAAAQRRALRHEQRWIPYARIAQPLKRAVLVAEDDAFWDHEGVDLEQIRKALEEGLARGRAVRGASTITQQVAKNLYLSPSRNPLRKLREIVIARRLEAALPKARILELYLNLIEWGDGTWGAEAAARRYFGVSASALGPEQAALLAGAIVNPRVLDPAHPNGRLRRRQQIILSRMGTMTPPAPVAAAQPPSTSTAPGQDPGAERRSETSHERTPESPAGPTSPDPAENSTR